VTEVFVIFTALIAIVFSFIGLLLMSALSIVILIPMYLVIALDFIFRNIFFFSSTIAAAYLIHRGLA